MYQKHREPGVSSPRVERERLYSHADTAEALEESVNVCLVCWDRWR